MTILSVCRFASLALIAGLCGLLLVHDGPALAFDGTPTVSDVSGKRVKLYSGQDDRKAADRVEAKELVGSKVTDYNSRRVRIEFKGKPYWVDAYKIQTNPPLSLKEVPVGCDNLAMSSNANSYSTARGAGKSGGCN